MTYLTKEEFTELGFECEGDFYKLLKRAKLAIDAFTRDFYFLNSFNKEIFCFFYIFLFLIN